MLLPEQPQLHRFPGGGKDGGIDLITDSAPYFVAECKVVGKDDYSQIEQRWKTVKGHLEDHLAHASGPTKGQSQYTPWYSTDSPIAQYLFCVSAVFANEQQRREFRGAICDYFHDLARRRPHLSHLAALEVMILDWNDLRDRLRKRPHTIFRWFPQTRPNGFIPLDEPLDLGTFRAYLNGSTLPYYSLAEHSYVSPPPKEAGIVIEDNLLAQFDNQTVTGLVVNGKGGIGKSRLALELGLKARKNGWTVMRVQSRLKSDALEKFVEHLSPDTPALLLIDYIETQGDYAELVENLNLYVDTGVANIRYVAACRTGYYHQAVASTSRHLPVDLSPPPGQAAVTWLRQYRLASVRRILTQTGITVTERHLAVCHDLPILAVFQAYLHASGRTEELDELLNEAEFGRWVARRVQLSFPKSNVSRDLALLVPMFPMADTAVAKLQSKPIFAIFERLATDGWIEKIAQPDPIFPNEWVAAHDVLVDQMLSAHLRSIPNTAETFAAELFSLAAELGCLDSTLVALQRVADIPPLNALPWSTLIGNGIRANEPAWRSVRDVLIRTTLLDVQDKIALLSKCKGLWDDAEREINFHNALGWLCRLLATTNSQPHVTSLKQELLPWVLKAASFVDRSNYLLTWGLRLAPDTLRDVALRWISARPTLFQSHYLMVAWLEAGLAAEPIAASVQSWCQKFSRNEHLSFIADAWLGAGGDRAMVEQPIREWLGVHKTDPEAQFVYYAWLGAGGDKALVEQPIREWLGVHKTAPEARFVYNAWLGAGGDKALVEQPIREWLSVQKTDPEASHVHKAWLDAGGAKALVEQPIREWLGVHKADPKAQFVYNAWLGAGGDKALVEQPIREWLGVHKTDPEASHVYNAWLDAGGDKALVEQPIREWLGIHKTDSEAQFVYKAWLDAGGDKALVEQPIRKWLGVHKTDPEAQFVYNAWLGAGGDKALVEQPIREWLGVHKTAPEARFVYNAWLDAGGDKALVEQPIREWLGVHKTDPEASHVYNAWLDAGGDKALVEQPIREWLAIHLTTPRASYVLGRITPLGGGLLNVDDLGDACAMTEAFFSKAYTVQDETNDSKNNQIVVLLIYLGETAKLHSRKMHDQVDTLIMAWMRHSASFGRKQKAYLSIQKIEFARRVLLLLRSGELDVKKDQDTIRRFLEWVDEWDTFRKEMLRPTIESYSTQYPAPEIWDIVRFD